MIIQCTPNLSASMPNLGEKKVLVSGSVTWPPSPSALNMRSTSASLLALTASEKPSNFGCPAFLPSEASTVVSPIWNCACMTLFSEPGSHCVCSGASLKRISMPTLAPTRTNDYALIRQDIENFAGVVCRRLKY